MARQQLALRRPTTLLAWLTLAHGARVVIEPSGNVEVRPHATLTVNADAGSSVIGASPLPAGPSSPPPGPSPPPAAPHGVQCHAECPQNLHAVVSLANDTWRDASVHNNVHGLWTQCDYNAVFPDEGAWYTFGTGRRMPTQPHPPMPAGRRHCGTAATGWQNFADPPAGSVAVGQVCFGYGASEQGGASGDCWTSTQAQLCICDLGTGSNEYYYFLRPVGQCHAAYCFTHT